LAGPSETVFPFLYTKIMAAIATLNREKLLTTARTLPAAPQVLSELGEILQDVNTGLEEIADLLKRDAALAARIIRISNSSALGGGSRIGSVEEAVNRVGFSEVYRLVGLATTSRLADRDLNFYRVGAEQMRHHMMFNALVAEKLAEHSGMNSRDAYTAGLMRPLGMMVMDRIARERIPAPEPFDEAKFPGYAAWEGIIFGLSNCEVAGMILAEWKFPQEQVSAIGDHYLLREQDLGNRFAVLLNLAGCLTLQATLGLRGEPSYFTVTPEKLTALGIDEEGLKAAAAEAQKRFDRIKDSL